MKFRSNGHWSRNGLITFLKTSEAILFDLDGTLFDLNVNWSEIKQHFKDYTKERFNKCLPSNRFYANFKFIENNLGRDELEYYIDYLRQKEVETVKRKIPTRKWLGNEGIERIHKLTPENILFGIISSNFHQTIDEIILQYELADKFSIIIGRDDVTEAKPNPEGLLKAIKELKVNPEKVLYTGDVLGDQSAAKQAGVQFIFEDEFEALLKNK